VNLRLKEEGNKHYNTLINKFNTLITQSEGKEKMITTMTKQTFYPRLHNMTNIQLSNTEEMLLNKGSKYNMGIAPKECIRQSAKPKTQ
jgi:hypothetical protein